VFLNHINNRERHIQAFERNSLGYVVPTHLVAVLNYVFENRMSIIHVRPESSFFRTLNIIIRCDHATF